MNSLERMEAVLAGRAVDRVPVFPLIMGLAADRFGVSYRRFATEPEVMAGAQVNVHQRYGVDAITACSDAFRIAADLGAEMVYPEDQPPAASAPLVSSGADLERLGRPDPLCTGSRMEGRVRAVTQMVREVGKQCMVLGWVDMPFAEACSLCGVQAFMTMLVLEPGLARAVLEFLTPIVTDFALAQLRAGAPMIGAGDAAASLISPALYREFAQPYEKRVADAIHEAGGRVKLHICGNTSALLNDMAAVGCDLYNVDHAVDIEQACRVYGGAGRCFKGNLDPVGDMLQSSPQQCQARCRELIEQCKGTRFILSAGCEVPAGVSDEVLRAFCRAPLA